MILLTLPLFFIALIFALIYLIRGILHVIKKEPVKPMFIRMFISLGAALLLLIGTINLTSKDTETNASNDPKKEETNTTTTVDETDIDEDSEIDETKTDKKIEAIEEEEEEEEPALSEREKSEYSALEESQLDGMKRKPEEHYGELVKFSGKVIQVSSGEVEFVEYYRVAIDDNYDHVVLVKVLMPNEIDAGRILEDDYVTLYSKYEGLNTYESTTGKSVTLPYFTTFGKTIELSNE